MNAKLVEAIDLALGGQWDAAHRIVQEFDGDPNAAWIHAVLHKIEGDHNNSRYWYSRAGKLASASVEPQSELAQIRASLSEHTFEI